MQFVIIGIIIVIVAYLGWHALRFFVRNYTESSRSYRMTFLRIVIPKKESREDREKESEGMAQKDFKEVLGVMNQFYEGLYGLYSSRFKNVFRGQYFLGLEYAVLDGQIQFYIVCPPELKDTVEKLLTGYFPDCYVEQASDYNIFNKDCQVSGLYLNLAMDHMYPFKTYQYLNIDPLNNITNAFSKINENEGASLQIMIKPFPNGWQKDGRDLAKNKLNQKEDKSFFSYLNPIKWVSDIMSYMLNPDAAGKSDLPGGSDRMTQLAEEEIKAIEEKSTSVGFETVIRLVAAAPTQKRAAAIVDDIVVSFSQFGYPDGNGFMVTKYHSLKRLTQDYVLRKFSLPFFKKHFLKKMILSTDELASLFHLPNIRYNQAPNIAWQNYKIAPPPKNIPTEGILLGHNLYRGVKTEIRMKNEDRFRHFYVIGQTGTGKSSIFQSMIRQDLKSGAGLCVIDPHGSLVDDILPFIPKERADDVIYFSPADLERPMGLNLFEAEGEAERDLVALDAMNIMIKMFDEEIFGPRIQDYFRNGCLTLMEYPDGGALTDIVRLFTDDAFQQTRVEHVKNPIVRSFWDNQMAQTGAREKQEMIPYFAAKFGAFVTNAMMRNIIGQTKSSFDFSDVMQEGKILLMNLSKGEVGDINSKLLGLIIVSKLQMAALRRQRIPKELRRDFYLYIDEFQNYITDSIESILSEARKYRLSLNLAHQYIGQLSEGNDEKIKNAVFGNVGTMMAYKIGAQDAEYLAKEMAPVFSDQDLINVDKYKAVMKLSIDTQPSRPFSITPLNPYTEKGDMQLAEAYKQLSRLKFGRDVEFVSREILRRIGG
ncbi:type IV secretion system DNA-binding domain-containing protein [Candidatus Gracilibacteria bacterium]|jgi:hypothetical protein|nr:type IV secretion system DNA-binding domain-containing protein [Candidatus Gracilibacteria bacterium]